MNAKLNWVSPPSLSQSCSLGRGFSLTVGGDIGNLVNPSMRVNSLMTQQLATMRESWLLPPLTQCSNFCTLTFRAPHRHHILWCPCVACGGAVGGCLSMRKREERVGITIKKRNGNLENCFPTENVILVNREPERKMSETREIRNNTTKN